MNGFILRLCILTAILTLCGGTALLFRLTRAGRCGRVMSRVWAVVLVLAILPLRLPAAWLPEAEQPVARPVAEQPSAAVPVIAEPRYTVAEQPSRPPTAVQTVELQAGRPALPIAALLVVLWSGGALVMLTLALRRNRKLNTMLRTCSHPCEENETLAILVDLAHRAGLDRLPELRILDAGIAAPPCTTGIFRPCIYLPVGLPDAHVHLAAILAHELCHIRRRDIWRKLFALTVCAVHWFNPIAHAILPRVYEDLEPACDRDTLRLLGGEPARIGYMQTLLEVAAGMTAWRNDHLALGLGSQKQQIERRFTGMKKARHNKLYSLLALLLICAMALGASVVFTACVPAKAAENPLDALTPLTDRIVRYHYDLAPGDAITEEMLEGITSLRLSVAGVCTNLDEKMRAAEAEEAENQEIPLPEDASDDLIAWAQSVIAGNAATIERYAAERVLLADVLENKTLVSFHVNYADASGDSYEAAQAMVDTFEYVPARFFAQTICASVEDDWTLKKYNAFYCLKDANDETLGKRQRDIMLAIYPWSDAHPTYVCDPYRSAREYLQLYYVLYAHGILDPQLLDSTAVDMTQFAVFPNLNTVELVGLTEAK